MTLQGLQKKRESKRLAGKSADEVEGLADQKKSEIMARKVKFIRALYALYLFNLSR